MTDGSRAVFNGYPADGDDAAERRRDLYYTETRELGYVLRANEVNFPFTTEVEAETRAYLQEIVDTDRGGLGKYSQEVLGNRDYLDGFFQSRARRKFIERILEAEGVLRQPSKC